MHQQITEERVTNERLSENRPQKECVLKLYHERLEVMEAEATKVAAVIESSAEANSTSGHYRRGGGGRRKINYVGIR